MLTKAGMTHLITMDLHQKEVTLITHSFKFKIIYKPLILIYNFLDTRIFRHAGR